MKDRVIILLLFYQRISHVEIKSSYKVSKEILLSQKSMQEVQDT